MPTENRSSNTEMVSVPKVRAELLINLLAEVARTAHWLADNSEDCGDEGIDCQRVDFEALSDALDKCEELPELPDSPYVRDGWLRAADELRALLSQSAEQHQGEPVAVVGIVPGTDYKSLDFKADLQQLAVGAELYTHAGPGEVERLRSCLDAWKEVAARRLEDWKHAVEANERQHAQLAERDALLDRVVDHAKFWHDHPYAEVVEAIAKDYKALSASAEPSAPTDCAICRDLGSQCMECEEGEFREWADRHFAAADYRKTDAGVFIQDWMRHAYAAWCARGALSGKQ